MITKRISWDIETAAELLREGSLVAVPTATVYGLEGNGLDEQVIESIYEVPAVRPLGCVARGRSRRSASLESWNSRWRFRRQIRPGWRAQRTQIRSFSTLTGKSLRS